MVNIRSALSTALVAFAGLTLAASTPAAPPADPRGPLAGTWGLAPVDRQPGVSGSYLAIYRGDGGMTYADLYVYPGGWDCSLETKEVVWNAGKSRFEWLNESEKGKGNPCWMTAVPKGEKLDLTIWCPWNCTDGKNVHQLTLERISDVRLAPPVHTVHTFCSTHDVLRQQFCLPGAVQDAIARIQRAAKQRNVLSDEDEDLPDIEETMLGVLEGCHARGGDGSCLLRELEGRAKQVETAVSSRQASLAKERRTSEAASVMLARADQRKAWEGTWQMADDEITSELTIGACDEKQCRVSLVGETAGYGESSRRNACILDDVVMRYLDPNRGFAYLEPKEDDANEAGAGPFANFCRIDLERNASGVRVRVRGAGCQRFGDARCEKLTGEYRP
jgi:hypothetical protein